MKKLTTLIAIFSLVFTVSFAAPGVPAEGNGGQEGQATTQPSQDYTADYDAIESLFDDAEFTTEEVPFDQIEQVMSASPNTTNNEGSLVAAIVLCFFLGGLAIHRVILGGRAVLILFYLITCGGIFGIVPFVDFILLIVDAVNGGGTRFENNDKFIAW